MCGGLCVLHGFGELGLGPASRSALLLLLGLGVGASVLGLAAGRRARAVPGGARGDLARLGGLRPTAPVHDQNSRQVAFDGHHTAGIVTLCVVRITRMHAALHPRR